MIVGRQDGDTGRRDGFIYLLRPPHYHMFNIIEKKEKGEENKGHSRNNI